MVYTELIAKFSLMCFLVNIKNTIILNIDNLKAVNRYLNENKGL
jgi:hypothetical protein